MNGRTLGWWIRTRTSAYFIVSEARVHTSHKQRLRDVIEMGSDVFSDKEITITRCTLYRQCPKFVILKDKQRGEVVASLWTPESPIPLECDHRGADRYLVIDFANTIEEAQRVISMLSSP